MGHLKGREGVGLTEMDRGLLGGACLEWGLSGWAGQPYGNMGERQAGVLDSAGGGRAGEEEGRRVSSVARPRSRKDLFQRRRKLSCPEALMAQRKTLPCAT